MTNEEVKKKAGLLGADLCGVASMDRFGDVRDACPLHKGKEFSDG